MTPSAETLELDRLPEKPAELERDERMRAAGIRPARSRRLREDFVPVSPPSLLDRILARFRR